MRSVALKPPSARSKSQPSISVIGAGNHASRVLIPAIAETGGHLKSVASAGGASSVHAGRRHGFEQATTDTDGIFSDSDTDAVVIATRHDSHAGFVVRAIEMGKHVFVEKPLCLALDELDAIETAYREKVEKGDAPILMVGFNRRFAPQIEKARSLLEAQRAPKAFVITVNAGAVPQDHWTRDPEIGGGRIVGEACHFVDLMRHLVGAPIAAFDRLALKDEVGDSATLQLAFADGSTGTIHYLANGHRSLPKERLEVFCAGKVLQLANFRRLKGYGWPGFKAMNLWRQDKGQRACVEAFIDALRNGSPSPIPPEEIFEVSRTTIALAQG